MVYKERKSVRIYSFLVVFFSLLLVAGAPNLQAQKAGITWYSMQEAQNLAKKNDKKVLAYAEASWCVYCKKMEEEVFPRQMVIDSLNTYFYPVRIDIDSDKSMVFNGEKISQQQFARRHKVRATPTTFFVNKNGKIMGAQPGFIPADTFSKLLAFVGSEAFQQMDFKLYLKHHAKAENK